MKAIFEVDDSTSEGREEMRRITKAIDMALVLFEIESNLKKKIEHKLDKIKEIDCYDTLEMVFNEISDLYEEFDIKTDKLIS